MAYLLIKIAITTVLVVLVSEISRRSTLIGAVLASFPIVSLLAIIWLYIDTKSVEKVSTLATSILWLIAPSLSLFILLPILLRRGVSFLPALVVSISVMVAAYLVTAGIAQRVGVAL